MQGYTEYRSPKGASWNPWIGEIDLADLTTHRHDVTGMAEKIADRLATFPPATTEYEMAFDDVIDMFRDAADDGGVEAFDAALRELYDWGDARRFLIKALNQ